MCGTAIIQTSWGANQPNYLGVLKRQMPNMAAALKAEISRIARKEVRAETEILRKQSSQYRIQIAALKRQLAKLERERRSLARNTKTSPAAIETHQSLRSDLRFRSKGFAMHRRRLGLSAAQAGALLGVSGQTIYHWETGKAKPHASQMPRISALRKLSKTQAAAAVSQVMG